MLTFKDYKVKAKKILVIAFPFLECIKSNVHYYEGYRIYEDLYCYYDFYVMTKNGWTTYGSYRHIINFINKQIEQSCTE